MDLPSENASSDTPRRNFLSRMAAFLVGFVAAAVPAGAGIGFLCDPLLRKKRGAGNTGDSRENMVRLDIAPDAVPADGTPIRVTVFSDRVDAWNHYPRQPVGSIWLRRLPTGEVAAWQSICPHLGCTVEYRSGEHDFYCPCHASTFDLEGARQNQIPPRDMDQLELAVDGKSLWVKYEKFRGGIRDKVAV